jgi:hypothetical protein
MANALKVALVQDCAERDVVPSVAAVVQPRTTTRGACPKT